MNKLKSKDINQIHNQIIDRVKVKIYKRAEAQVRGHDINPAYNPVYHSVINQINNQVGFQTYNQVWSRVWRQVGNQVTIQVRKKIL